MGLFLVNSHGSACEPRRYCRGPSCRVMSPPFTLAAIIDERPGSRGDGAPHSSYPWVASGPLNGRQDDVDGVEGRLGVGVTAHGPTGAGLTSKRGTLRLETSSRMRWPALNRFLFRHNAMATAYTSPGASGSPRVKLPGSGRGGCRRTGSCARVQIVLLQNSGSELPQQAPDGLSLGNGFISSLPGCAGGGRASTGRARAVPGRSCPHTSAYVRAVQVPAAIERLPRGKTFPLGDSS